jgi:RNA polymerase sigma-70 factor (ECF subfamily)
VTFTALLTGNEWNLGKVLGNLMLGTSLPKNCIDQRFAKLIRGCWFARVVVMSERSPDQIREQIRELVDSLYRVESGRILATLIRLLGDFDLAEEAMHEAFAAALGLWPRSGLPGNPRPWLISTARFKAIDTLRRRARLERALDASQGELLRYLEAQLSSAQNSNDEDSLEDGFEDAVEDDRLRLMFTCCHPALPPEARVALTLREVCGLTTEEIARGFLITPSTLAQRIVRAKAKIRETPIPYEVPSPQELPERLGAVLHVIYLVFNEGYSAAAGAEVTRAELTGEAIRLGRLLTELQPAPEVLPEIIGLLALMLLQASRHASRTSRTGELILLEHQDRSLWNREQIAEGLALLEKALKSGRFGSYTLQAAIAAVHAEAESVTATDWRQIVALYDRLLRIQPSPVVQLNRAVAVAMCDGPEAGLTHIDAVLEHDELANYYLAHSARADMYRRLGRTAEARSSYEKALALTQQEPERQFLQERIRQLG